MQNRFSISELDYSISKASKRLNILILGDASVGKTSLVKLYNNETFELNRICTLGVDFYTRKVKSEYSNQTYKVCLWDTAGQERFRSIAHTFYKSSKAIIVAFDVTSLLSFENVVVWLKGIYQQASEEVVIILVGNKVDLKDQRRITFEQGRALANKYKIRYFETSASLNYNVENMFDFIIDKVVYQDQDKTSYSITHDQKSSFESESYVLTKSNFSESSILQKKNSKCKC
eukprot:403347619